MNFLTIPKRNTLSKTHSGEMVTNIKKNLLNSNNMQISSNMYLTDYHINTIYDENIWTEVQYL